MIFMAFIDGEEIRSSKTIFNEKTTTFQAIERVVMIDDEILETEIPTEESLTLEDVYGEQSREESLDGDSAREDQSGSEADESGADTTDDSGDDDEGQSKIC